MESAGLLTPLQPLVPVSTCLLSTPKPQNSSSGPLGPLQSPRGEALCLSSKTSVSSN